MADLFIALGTVAIAFFVALAGITALALRRLIRANRVAPGRRSTAPLSWQVSPRAPARLHRRLRRAVASSDLSAGTIAPASVTLRDVASEITTRAVGLDDWLVAANGLHPLVRRSRLHELAAEVREVEVSVARLHRLSVDWRRHLDQSAMAMAIPPPNLHERLDAVEAALRELPATASAPPAMPPLRAPGAPAAAPLAR